MTMDPTPHPLPVMPDSSSSPSAPPVVVLPQERPTSQLVRELLRPYHLGLAIVLFAMIVETAMSIAAPWPLKVVLDNAVGHDSLPAWLHWVHDIGLPRDTMGLAAF